MCLTMWQALMAGHAAAAIEVVVGFCGAAAVEPAVEACVPAMAAAVPRGAQAVANRPGVAVRAICAAVAEARTVEVCAAAATKAAGDWLAAVTC